VAAHKGRRYKLAEETFIQLTRVAAQDFPGVARRKDLV
jgi:hypothetical protein